MVLIIDLSKYATGDWQREALYPSKLPIGRTILRHPDGTIVHIKENLDIDIRLIDNLIYMLLVQEIFNRKHDDKRKQLLLTYKLLLQKQNKARFAKFRGIQRCEGPLLNLANTARHRVWAPGGTGYILCEHNFNTRRCEMMKKNTISS